VAEALKVLAWAGVLSWQHRITRVRERCRDLFGQEGWRWRVIRTSNAYVFRDPKAAVSGGFPSKSENRLGTLNQEFLDPVLAPAGDPDSPLERALARFHSGRRKPVTRTARSNVPLPDSTAVAGKKSIEQEAAG
jgi:hypothetical protein